MGCYQLTNKLINKFNYKTYLEIGVADPRFNYYHVMCESKEGCDPYYDTSGLDFTDEVKKEEVTYWMTSDEMFSVLPEDKKYDCIFIDGLHTEDQSKRDIVNSLKHLNENGLILVHDVFPREERFTGDVNTTEEWYGNVYKSILDFKKIGGRFCSVREGENVTIIPYQKLSERQIGEYLAPSEFTYADYEKDTDEVMWVIPSDNIFKKVLIYHNNEYLSKNASLTSIFKI